MEIILIILGSIFAIGLLIMLVVICRDNDLSEWLPVYKPNKKKVASVYWGSYAGSNTTPETDDIQLPKITEWDQAAVIGSEVYSKGRPVKSLRR